MNASVLVGSSLGGVLAVSPGPWLVYALDAAGFGVSFVLLSRGVPPLPPPPATAGDGAAAPALSDGPALREILVGLRYAASRKDLLGSYLADLSAMIFAYPNAMLPFLAIELHASWSTGLMFAAPSAGAFAVSATSGWMPRVRRHGLAIALAAGGWGLSMALVGVSPSVWFALAFLAVAGGADECSAVFRDTMWKQSIPDHLRGRLAGIELLSYAAGPPRAAPVRRGGGGDRAPPLPRLRRPSLRRRRSHGLRHHPRLPPLHRPRNDHSLQGGPCGVAPPACSDVTQHTSSCCYLT